MTLLLLAYAACAWSMPTAIMLAIMSTRLSVVERRCRPSSLVTCVQAKGREMGAEACCTCTA